MAAKICDICGGPLGLMKMTYPDGFVCHKCFSKANTQIPRIYKNAAEVRAVLDQELADMSADERTAFFDKLSEGAHEKYMAEIQTKIRQNNVPVKPSASQPVPHCPKCNSTSISADKKGFGIGKAVAGAAFAGPVGLVAGNLGAKQVRITCLNCGHQWTAGKA